VSGILVHNEGDVLHRFGTKPTRHDDLCFLLGSPRRNGNDDSQADLAQTIVFAAGASCGCCPPQETQPDEISSLSFLSDKGGVESDTTNYLKGRGWRSTYQSIPDCLQ